MKISIMIDAYTGVVLLIDLIFITCIRRLRILILTGDDKCDVGFSISIKVVDIYLRLINLTK